ncbi:hypothetical protein D3C76_1683650 [compost metagenome]
MLLSQTAAGRAAGLDSLEFFASGNTAANLKNNLTQRNTHRDLNQAGIHHLAAKREYFGAL